MKCVYCSQCGSPLTSGTKFCGQCGGAVPQPSDAIAAQQQADPKVPGSNPSAGQIAEVPALKWQADMTLLTNRFFLVDMAKCIGITMMVFGVIIITIFGMSGGAKGMVGALLLLALPLVLIVLGTLIFVAIMGNRLPMEFTIDSYGIRMKSISRRVAGINRTAIVLGILAGKPGAIGAGQLGRAQENTSIAWSELSKIRFYPDQRVIYLKGGFLSRIRVYCTPQNYPTAEQTIRGLCPSHAVILPSSGVIS